MASFRLHDGFDEPDRIAFGLPAAQLLVVVGAALTALLTLRSGLPGVLKVPPALLIAAMGAGLGWLRWRGRPALEWAVLGAKFYARPRQFNVVLMSQEDGESPRPTSEPRDEIHPVQPPRPGNTDWQSWLTPKPEVPATAPAPEPTQLTVLDAPASEPLETVEDELPEGDLEVDDDDFGVILPFTRADDDDEIELTGRAISVADEVAMDVAPTPTAFVGATRRITFFSLNGGTGKTTLCTEVAGLLASRGEHTPNGLTRQRLRVAIVDLDLRSASVSVRLGIPQPTIWDYARQDAGSKAAVGDFMVKHPSGLKALLGPPKPVATNNSLINPESVADIVAELEADGFHYIFFDVTGELTPTTTWVLNAVHDIFIVLTATASGLQDAYRTAEVLRRMGLRHKLSYVVNRARGNLDFGTTMNDLNGRLVAEIPYDHQVEDAENSHQLVAVGDGPAASAIARLAATIYPALGVAAKPKRALPWRRAKNSF